MLRKLSLFSGIGGDDLASEWAGIETMCMVEKDKYCRQVLKKNFPGIPIIEDVKDVTKETLANAIGRTEGSAQDEGNNAERSDGQQYNRNGLGNDVRNGSFEVNIIAGGFPCQPHSVAGKRKGSIDERNLWPEFRRVIGLFKPGWVVGENVPGIFTSDGGLFFNGILCDLAEMGYSAGWCTFGAVDVGALHRRNRVFIVAHTIDGQHRRKSGPTGETEGIQGINRETLQPREFSGTSQESSIVGDSECNGCTNRCKETERKDGRSEQRRLCESEGAGIMVDSTKFGVQGYRSIRQQIASIYAGKGLSVCGCPGNGTSYWQSEPDVGRVANGVPHRVDRLRGLGNAVVPQQIYPIYKAIVEIENMVRTT